jgi:tetratricopeptide (TPR) repeat protein
MKKFFSLYLLLFCLGSIHGMPLRHVHFISPKYVKGTRDYKKITAQYGSYADKEKQHLPKIHRTFWPYFCQKHLIEDPEGCSSWGEDAYGRLELEFTLDGNATAYFDRQLINRIAPFMDLIPKSTRKCEYAWCPTCKQTVISGVCWDDEYDEEDEGEENAAFLVLKCGCTDYWIGDTIEKEDYDMFKAWKYCKAHTINPNYVEWDHKTYFRFLENHLSYVTENPSCNCYWPQIGDKAKGISDGIYISLLNELESSDFDKVRETFYLHKNERTKHGFLSELFTHAFFYSDYHSIFTDLDQHCLNELPEDYPSLHKKLISKEEEIQAPFLSLYNECLRKHPHPKIYYERGMVLFHQGENIESLKNIRKFIAYAEKYNQDLLSSNLYLNEGRLLSENLSYDEAIVALSKAISKDPKNSDAYFERAIAYFETGDFQKSLLDYLASGIKPKKIDPKMVGKLNALKLGQGIALGLLEGGKESAVEFVPSLISCLRGISRGIWVFASNPIEVSQDMVECANACVEFIKETTAKELISELVPELQKCLKNWNSLEDSIRGQIIGHVIGKYGVDVFIGSGSMKAIQLYRNLRKANAIMTLEAASISPKNAQEIMVQCAKEWKLREEVLKNGNIKILWDQQGKHIPWKHNFIEGRSIFEHANPQKLLDAFAGTGKRVGNVVPGSHGYREIVDFQEHIGIWKSDDGILSLPTTRGTIHYGKKGAHIVPAEPKL